MKHEDGTNEFLETLGKLDIQEEIDDKNSEMFLLKIIYNDQKNNKLCVARDSKWKSMKNKSTARLPPDKDSYRQHVYRAHHQAKVWYSFRDSGDPPNPVGHGYRLSGHNLVPSPHTREAIPIELREMMNNAQSSRDDSS